MCLYVFNHLYLLFLQVLLLMRNLSINLSSPDFEPIVSITTCCHYESNFLSCCRYECNLPFSVLSWKRDFSLFELFFILWMLSLVLEVLILVMLKLTNLTLPLRRMMCKL